MEGNWAITILMKCALLFWSEKMGNPVLILLNSQGPAQQAALINLTAQKYAQLESSAHKRYPTYCTIYCRSIKNSNIYVINIFSIFNLHSAPFQYPEEFFVFHPLSVHTNDTFPKFNILGCPRERSLPLIQLILADSLE